MILSDCGVTPSNKGELATPDIVEAWAKDGYTDGTIVFPWGLMNMFSFTRTAPLTTKEQIIFHY